MVGASGEVRVMDWGLAKILADDEAEPRRPDDRGGVSAPGIAGQRVLPSSCRVLRSAAAEEHEPVAVVAGDLLGDGAQRP
jgi:hypothetical protein